MNDGCDRDWVANTRSLEHECVLAATDRPRHQQTTASCSTTSCSRPRLSSSQTSVRSLPSTLLLNSVVAASTLSQSNMIYITPSLLLAFLAATAPFAVASSPSSLEESSPARFIRVARDPSLPIPGVAEGKPSDGAAASRTGKGSVLEAAQARGKPDSSSREGKSSSDTRLQTVRKVPS